MSEEPSPEDDLQLIVDAARAAGRLALDHAATGIDKWEKSPGNPVTAADMAIDKQLHETLLTARPAYGWLSEERADDDARLDCDRAFLVDPIDGTRDYARGRPGWCVSIAIVEAGRPTVAVLYAPVPNTLYTATVGSGAFRNGERIGVSDVADLADARMCVDADVFRSKFWKGPTCAAVPKPNSIALRMARIAEGEADALFDGRPSRELDVAASVLILTEAGGVVSDTEGEVPRFNKPIPTERNLIAAASPELLAATRVEAKAMLERWVASKR
ncbi:MAG: 3'(2'),5'-bisphosphate nucleotidase CysQ [Pacificimonas sp.]